MVRGIVTAGVHERGQASGQIGLGEAAGRSTGLQRSGQACMSVRRPAYGPPEPEAPWSILGMRRFCSRRLLKVADSQEDYLGHRMYCPDGLVPQAV